MRVLKISSNVSLVTVAAIGLSGSGYVAAQDEMMEPDPMQVRNENLADQIRYGSGRVAHLCEFMGTLVRCDDSNLIPRVEPPYHRRGEPFFTSPTARSLYNPTMGKDYGMDRPGDDMSGPGTGNGTRYGQVDSVSQSSTVHDLDMQISVEAEYKYDRPGTESHPHLRDITQADPSWWSLSDARDDDTGYTGFETSDRIRRTAQFRVDASWSVDENEAHDWRANTTAPNSPHAMATRGRLSQNNWRHNIALERSLEGGRVLRMDVYSDIAETKMPARRIMLEGPYLRDDRHNNPDDYPNPEAHRDWSSSDLHDPVVHSMQRAEIEDAINFDNPEVNVRAVPEHAGHADDGTRSNHGEFRRGGGLFVEDGGDLEPGEREYVYVGEMVQGTWRGVRGQFVCRSGGPTNPNSCTISAQDFQRTGRVHHARVISGTWEFVPTRGEMVVVDDTDWLTVGVWEIAPRSDANMNGDYSAGAFAVGNDPFDETRVAALTGSATYQGEAVGMYTQSLGSGIQKDRFVATAMLTANFGNGADLGTVNGNVSNFRVGMDGTGTNWDLNLETACIGGGCASAMDGPGDSGVPDNAFRGDTSGFADGHAIDGRWSGRFYGNDRADGEPGAIAGTFGAAMAEDSGAAVGGYRLDLLGAFGAYHQ